MLHKRKKSQNNYIIFYLQKQGKEEIIKPKIAGEENLKEENRKK